MKAIIYLLLLLGPGFLLGQSVEVKEKKGETYLMVKKKVIAGPFASVKKVYGTDQYLVKTDRWGIVDELGKEVVASKYDSISHASGDYYLVGVDGQLGIMDKTGTSVVEPKFQRIDHFTKEQRGLVKFEDRWMIYRDGELHEEADSLVFRSPEIMPKFSNCEEGERAKGGMSCDAKEMLNFIYENITYPSEAIAAKIEGIVVVKFIVEKDGALSDFEIIREIGGGCGEEAIKVVKKMNPWVPGMQDGEVVRTGFYLPVKYAL